MRVPFRAEAVVTSSNELCGIASLHLSRLKPRKTSMPLAVGGPLVFLFVFNFLFLANDLVLHPSAN